jgi:DNA-binding transcriptional LysR family regulator
VELRQLEHFLAVVEEGSFTRAAARVFLVQSSLSASLLALERELGTALFIRGRRGAELTDAGRALLEPARSALQKVQHARDAVAEVQGLLRGTVRIATVFVPSSIDLIDPIREFRAQNPNVEVFLRPADPATMVRLVEDGEVDFAITPRVEQGTAPLLFQPLVSSPLVIICPADHRLAGARDVEPHDLVAESIIDLPRGWRSRDLFDQLFEDAELRREVRLEVDDWSRAQAMVRKGLGISYGPSECIGEEFSGLIMPATLTDAPLWELGITARAPELRGPAGRAFLATYLEHCARSPARWSW